MSTLLEKARAHDLRAVRTFGRDDHFLVWEAPAHEVFETTDVTCTCDRLNLRGNCVHQGFVRELIARGIDAIDPVRIAQLKRPRPAPKLPADGRTTSAFLGVAWCPTAGRWQASLSIAGTRYTVGRFEREEDAARAYDWATWHRPDLETRRMGQRPRFNFPDELPPPAPAIKPTAAIYDVLNVA